MKQADAGATARIHDQGYRPFDGRLASVRTRFAAIAVNELRQAWKSKWVRRVEWASFFPLGVLAVLMLVRTRMETVLGPSRIWLHFWNTQLFFVMLAVYFAGRRAVGEDLRTGALTVYFSRAVDFRQYLLGKWLAVAIAVCVVVLGPGLLLALFGLLADSGTGVEDFLSWLVALLALTGLLCLSGGWVVLAVSSLAGRGRAAGIVWVLLFFLSSAAGAGLAEATGVEGLRALGFVESSLKLAEVLFGHEPAGFNTVWFVLGHLGWAVAGAAVVLFRLRRWRGR